MRKQKYIERTNEQNPAIWFCENEDLWDNDGDHIEFHCPLEQVPESVLKAAEVYRQSQLEEDVPLKIYNKMGLNGSTTVINRVEVGLDDTTPLNLDLSDVEDEDLYY